MKIEIWGGPRDGEVMEVADIVASRGLLEFTKKNTGKYADTYSRFVAEIKRRHDGKLIAIWPKGES